FWSAWRSVTTPLPHAPATGATPRRQCPGRLAWTAWVTARIPSAPWRRPPMRQPSAGRSQSQWRTHPAAGPHRRTCNPRPAGPSLRPVSGPCPCPALPCSRLHLRPHRPMRVPLGVAGLHELPGDGAAVAVFGLAGRRVPLRWSEVPCLGRQPVPGAHLGGVGDVPSELAAGDSCGQPFAGNAIGRLIHYHPDDVSALRLALGRGPPVEPG